MSARRRPVIATLSLMFRDDELAASVLYLYKLARADDWRMRRALDQAVARLSAMLAAGRVSRTELRAVVDDLRTAAELPSVFGDHRRERDEDEGDDTEITG